MSNQIKSIRKKMKPQKMVLTVNYEKVAEDFLLSLSEIQCQMIKDGVIPVLELNELMTKLYFVIARKLKTEDPSYKDKSIETIIFGLKDEFKQTVKNSVVENIHKLIKNIDS